MPGPTKVRNDVTAESGGDADLTIGQPLRIVSRVAPSEGRKPEPSSKPDLTRPNGRCGEDPRERVDLTIASEARKVSRVAPSDGESQSAVRTRNLRTQQRA